MNARLMYRLLCHCKHDSSIASRLMQTKYYYWRASEAGETLSGLNNGNRRYICIIYIVRETSL